MRRLLYIVYQCYTLTFRSVQLTCLCRHVWTCLVYRLHRRNALQCSYICLFRVARRYVWFVYIRVGLALGLFLTLFCQGQILWHAHVSMVFFRPIIPFFKPSRHSVPKGSNFFSAIIPLAVTDITSTLKQFVIVTCALTLAHRSHAGILPALAVTHSFVLWLVSRAFAAVYLEISSWVGRDAPPLRRFIFHR